MKSPASGQKISVAITFWMRKPAGWPVPLCHSLIHHVFSHYVIVLGPGYIHIHIHIHLLIHNTCSHAYTCTYMHAHAYAYTPIHIDIHIHSDAHIYI